MSDNTNSSPTDIVHVDNASLAKRRENLTQRGLLHLSKRAAHLAISVKLNSSLIDDAANTKINQKRLDTSRKYMRRVLNPTELKWEDVEKICLPHWSVWNTSGKVRWAREAWQLIAQEGLTRYINEPERVQVIIRLLALAGIYADFYELAFEDGFAPNAADWATEFGISFVILNQLITNEKATNLNDPDDERDWLANTLQELANNARKEIVSTLFLAFGGCSGLFISLWKSRRMHSAGDENFADESDDEIVNGNLTYPYHKMSVFQWVDEGCYAR